MANKNKPGWLVVMVNGSLRKSRVKFLKNRHYFNWSPGVWAYPYIDIEHFIEERSIICNIIRNMPKEKGQWFVFNIPETSFSNAVSLFSNGE